MALSTDLVLGVMILLTALVFYLIGVRAGKKYSRTEITLEFQEVLNKLLHYAAQRNYHAIHLTLIDLCADEDLVSEIQSNPQAVEQRLDLSKLKETHLAPMDGEIPDGPPVPDEKKPTR